MGTSGMRVGRVGGAGGACRMRVEGQRVPTPCPHSGRRAGRASRKGRTEGRRARACTGWADGPSMGIGVGRHGPGAE